MELEEIRKNIKRKNHTKNIPHMKFKYQLLKLLLTIILTLSSLILLKQNPRFQKQFYKYVYEEQLEFTKFKKVYQKYLGKFLPDQLNINSTKKVFQEKLVYEKEPYKEGYKLKVKNPYLVPIIDSGMVVFIGNKEGFNKTVIVQQVNGVDVWYGNMTNVSVKLYDYIEKGALLGETKDELFLLFKKDGKVINGKEYL